MSRTIILLLSFALCCYFGCSHDHEHAGHNHENPAEEAANEHGHSHEAGPHGGHLIVVGDHAAHLELVSDQEGGRLTIYLTGPDGGTPLAPDEAPKVNLITDEGNKQLSTFPKTDEGEKASHFEVTDEALKEGSKGRIALTIGGKPYSAHFGGLHDHDVEGGHDDGHDEDREADHDDGHDEDRETDHDDGHESDDER